MEWHTQTMKIQADAKSSTARHPKPKARNSWLKIVGSMKDCDLHREAMRQGAEWRERMNSEEK